MDLVYVSERKIYGRLGMKPPSGQQGVQATVKIPPLVEVTGNRSWDNQAGPMAPHELVARAKRKIERDFAPVPFTTRHLRANQWISFDTDLAQVAVHEDDGKPPEDVALFVGQVPDGGNGLVHGLGLLLCGSVQHLRTHVFAGGRMGSDTTWLHDVILEVERREESGLNEIPQNLTRLIPYNRDEYFIEEAAVGVHNWVGRRVPPPLRGRLRGHAIVLMDIDSDWWPGRLLVATPLYVEAAARVATPRGIGGTGGVELNWSWNKPAHV